MKDYEQYDALGLVELVKRRETSAEALLEAAISRTEARDGEVNAVVIRMFEEARKTVAAGVPDGPFQGVPFLLKDLHLAWPGVRLTNGSKLFSDFVPEVESELVARYRKAGLVVFGKTHSPEYGLTTSSESVLFGQTRNPWNLEHTAGGSSGGASAAVAAGYLPLANASDGGGSIRIPASCCGLFGMKPTRGRTPLGPNSGEGWAGMSAVHAVSRSVRDSAALLDATAGPDLGAPYAAQPPNRPFLDEVSQAPGRLRISIQRQPWNGTEPHKDCLAALEDAVALCRDLGHEVEEAPFEVDSTILAPATLTILSASTRAMMEQRAEVLGRPLAEDDVEPGTWASSTRAALTVQSGPRGPGRRDPENRRLYPVGQCHRPPCHVGSARLERCGLADRYSVHGAHERGGAALPARWPDRGRTTVVRPYAGLGAGRSLARRSSDARGLASVDGQVDARNERSLVGCQEEGGMGDIPGRPHLAAQRDLGISCGDQFLLVDSESL